MTQRKRHIAQNLKGVQNQSFWSFSPTETCNMLILPGYHVWQYYTHSIISQGSTLINLWYPEFLWRLNYTLSRLLTVSLQPLPDVRLRYLVSSFFRGWNSYCAQFSCSVVSDSLWPHGLQHTKISCPSPTPGVCSNSCLLSRWWHPTISSSVAPSPPAFSLSQPSGSFLMSWLFASRGQSIGASALASALPMNIQDWIFIPCDPNKSHCKIKSLVSGRTFQGPKDLYVIGKVKD